MRRWQRRCCFHPCVQHTILSPENLEKTIITAANQDATVKEEGKCGRNEGEITSQRCTDLIDTVGCCGGSQVSQSASAFYNHRWSSWGGQRRGKFAGNSRKRARSCIAYLQFDHCTTTNLVPLLSLALKITMSMPMPDSVYPLVTLCNGPRYLINHLRGTRRAGMRSNWNVGFVNLLSRWGLLHPVPNSSYEKQIRGFL